MAELSLEELFPQTLGPQAVAEAQHRAEAEPQPVTVQNEPQPEPAAQAPTNVSREEFDGLRQMLGMVLQSQGPRYQQPQQQYQEPAPQPVDYSYKPKEFLDDEDATLLLTSNRPTAQLNKAFNKVAEEVYTPLIGELNKRDQAIRAMYDHIQAKEVAQQQQARATHNQQTFFSNHPETKPYEYLVPYEAQIIATEAAQNPVAFTGKSERDIHSLLSSRVLARAKAIAAAQGQGSQEDGEQASLPPSVPSATPRTALERGSGVRPGPIPVSKDPNKRALAEFNTYMGGRRR